MRGRGQTSGREGEGVLPGACRGNRAHGVCVDDQRALGVRDLVDPRAHAYAYRAVNRGLGDSRGLDVKVTKVVLDAAAQIRAANSFNDRPKGQYVLVTYAATYTGPERTADIESDLTWSFTTADSQVNDQAYEVTQADDEKWPTEARSGGTVRGQTVFDLPTGLIEGGILTVEGYDEDFDTVYADFQM